jgi:hypothetical protein
MTLCRRRGNVGFAGGMAVRDSAESEGVIQFYSRNPGSKRCRRREQAQALWSRLFCISSDSAGQAVVARSYVRSTLPWKTRSRTEQEGGNHASVPTGTTGNVRWSTAIIGPLRPPSVTPLVSEKTMVEGVVPDHGAPRYGDVGSLRGLPASLVLL